MGARAAAYFLSYIVLAITSGAEMCASSEDVRDYCDVESDENALLAVASPLLWRPRAGTGINANRRAEAAAPAAQQGLRKHPFALAAVSHSSRKTHSLNIKAQQRRAVASEPKPSGWFGDFDEDESSFTTEGVLVSPDDPAWAVKYGRDPVLDDPLRVKRVLGDKMLHESYSPRTAWQTFPRAQEGRDHPWNFFPGISDNGLADTERENPWRYTPSGWRQEYLPDRTAINEERNGQFPASFFDNFVEELDGYGRDKAPWIHDGKWYADNKANPWFEKSVNTTITCKDPGCVGAAKLYMYNPHEEEAALCSLSVFVHPTDYDDDWSREHVEYWKLNNMVAMRGCNPKTRGCNSSASTPLYPCLNQYNVQRIIDENGTIDIEGKITHFVDECPYKKNLLSAVAMGTCMVRNKSNISVHQAVPNVTNFTMPGFHRDAILKCNTTGCSAEAFLEVNPYILLNGGKCTLAVNVTQTDYDDFYSKLPEQVEFIAVQGVNLTKKAIQPKKNPCNERYGWPKKVNPGNIEYSVVKKHDVTKMLRESSPMGTLKFTAKNSIQVDECGYDGNLLYVKVRVDCKPPKKFTATPPKATRMTLPMIVRPTG